MKRQVVTIAENLAPWFDQYVLPRMREAAARWDAPLVVLTPSSRMGVLGQMLMSQAATRADRTFYVDADVLISRKTPSPFETFPVGALYAAEDAEPGDSRYWHRANDMITTQTILGPIEWSSGYFNAGVVLCDREHAAAWDEFSLLPLTFQGQSFINYRARKLGFTLGELPWTWNAMKINTPSGCNQSEAFLAHAAGMPAERRIAWMERVDKELP